MRLAVVDFSVNNALALQQAFGADPNVQVLAIAANSADPIGLINSALAAGGFSSVDVFSAGQAGRFNLGSLTIDAASLPTLAPQWTQTGALLGPQGSLMLYGSQIAAGPTGQNFIDSLASASQLNVAASTGLSGGGQLGSNWTLEALNTSAPAGTTLTPLSPVGFGGVLDNHAPLQAQPIVALASSLEDVQRTFTTAELLQGWSDPDGNALSVQGLSASSGILFDRKDGTWNYTPAPNANGTVSLTYTVTDGVLSQSGSQSFTLTAVNDPPLVLSTDYSRHQTTPRSSWASDIGLSDLNGDGWLDLVTTQPNLDQVSVQWGSANGFVNEQGFAVSLHPARLVLADVNGDGRQDIVTSSILSNQLSVLNNNGTGFDPAVQITVGAGPNQLATGDLNGDGRMDLVTVCGATNELVVLETTPNGFAAPQSLPNPGNGLFDVAMGDLNGDGRTDIVAVSSSGPQQSNILMWTNNGAGFDPVQTVFTVPGPCSVSLSDLNGDGRLDILAGPYAGYFMALNHGNGFDPAVQLGGTAFMVNSDQPILQDLNGDGLIDLAGTDIFGVGVAVVLDAFNTPSGSDYAVGSITGPTTPIAVGDINRDGLLDIVTMPATSYTGQAQQSILLGQGDSAPEDTVVTVLLRGWDVETVISVFQIQSLPAHGTLYADAALSQPVGIGSTVPASFIPSFNSSTATLYFKPDANWNGATHFHYAGQDDQGAISTIAAYPAIVVSAVNDAPTLSGPGALLADGSPNTTYRLLSSDLLSGWTDIETPLLQVTQLVADHGVVLDNGDGSFTLSPTANYSGLIRLDYNVSDGQASVPAHLSLNLGAHSVNLSPIAGPGPSARITGLEDTPITLDLVGSDPDGSVRSFQLSQLPSHATLYADAALTQVLSVGTEVLATAGQAQIYALPEANWFGPLDLSYLAVDNQGGISPVPALIGIDVLPVNDAPSLAQPITLARNGPAGTLYSISSSDLLAGWSDVENDPLSILGLSSSLGSLVDQGNGTWTLRPPAGYSGPISLSYAVSDGFHTVATQAQLDTLLNLRPIAGLSATSPVPTLAVGIEDTRLTVVLQGTDLDGAITSFELTQLPAHGKLYADAALTQALDLHSRIAVSATAPNTATVFFQGDLNWNGSDAFSYAAIDNLGLISGASALQSLSLTPVNDPAMFIGPTTALPDGVEDVPYPLQTQDLLQGWIDPDGEPVAVFGLSADHGTVVSQPDGSYVLLPQAQYNGPIHLRYDIWNGTSMISPPQAANRVLNIQAVNDAPWVAPIHFDAPHTLNDPNYGFGQAWIQAGDLNGDGQLDLLGLDDNFALGTTLVRQAIAVPPSATDPSGFQYQFSNLPNYAQGVALTDMNADGTLDFLAFDPSQRWLMVMPTPQPFGLWQVTQRIYIDPSLTVIAAGDLNGDRASDVLVQDFYTDQVAVMLNDGAGNLAAPTPLNLGIPASTIRDLVIGDVNGDGQADIVVLTDTLYLIKGRSAGGWDAPEWLCFQDRYSATKLSMGDMNGDGYPDIAVLSALSNQLSVLYNSPHGFVLAELGSQPMWNPTSLTLGDLQGQGLSSVIHSDMSSPYGPLQVNALSPQVQNGVEDQALTLTLSGNDVDSTLVAFRLDTLPAHGTLYTDAALLHPLSAGASIPAVPTPVAAGAAYAAEATLYFQPDPHWHGDTQLHYVAVDDQGSSSWVAATEAIHINPASAPPTLSTVSFSDLPDVAQGDNTAQTLAGLAGDDHLYGGGGNDWLIGGAGMDVLEGGAGADRFVIQSAQDSLPSAMDRILDFNPALDVLDLSAIDANSTLPGDQAFLPSMSSVSSVFIGSAAFSQTPGELRFQDWTLSGDINGDGIADFAIRLIGVEQLPATAVIF